MLFWEERYSGCPKCKTMHINILSVVLKRALPIV